MRDRDLRPAAGGPGAGLVIFDCDGVLVDSEILSMRAYKDILADIGVEVPGSLWESCIGLKQADIFALIENAAGRKVPTAVRERLWPRTRELFESELEPTPGVAGFLASLACKRCVASSSSPERIRLSLRRTGLEAFFGDSVFSTQYVPRGKPAPDIFLFAAQRMGVEPVNCVVIEDSAPGVRAAVAAGIPAIGFLGGAHVNSGHGDRLRDAGARRLAESWFEVARIFAQDVPIAL